MAKRITSEEKERIKELRYQGYGSAAIAKFLGRSHSSIKRQFKALGLPGNLKEAGIEPKNYYPVLKTIQCKRCGKDYETKRFNAKFCSERCRRIYNTDNIAPKKMCVGCKEPFRTYQNNSFCSMECKRRYMIRNKRIIIRKVKCKGCGNTFYPKHKRMYCKPSCSYENNYISQAKTHSIKCKECGKHKTVSFKRKSFCSTKCSRRYGYRAQETKRRWQILSNGDVNWNISIDRLIKRDGSYCYICNEKVNKYEDANSDMYPSIEHVIPIAKGGTHTWDNVKLAHRKCNWEKGIEILEEELFIK